MNKPAEDFGESGIIRRYCDACGKPITLCWRGRNGEYCSNSCLKEKEKSNTMVTAANTEVEDEEEVEDVEDIEEEDDAPVTAGKTKKKAAPAAKKAAGKKAAPPAKAAAKKAAPAAKAAPGNSPVGRSSYPDDAVISVKKADHDLKGKRGDALSCLKEGITVGKFRAALEKKDLKGYAGWALKTAVENRMITVK